MGGVITALYYERMKRIKIMNNITVTVSIENIDDIRSFIKKVSMIEEFAKLDSDQKLKILCSYPVVMKFI